jgi:hypothetical protein
MPAVFTSPILALEFASSLTEVRPLFGDASELIRRVHIGHYIDMVFLCAYGAFLSLANIGAWAQWGRFINGAIAAVIASLADFAENILLMQLTGALLSVAAAPNFILLQFFVSFKFLAIAFSMTCLVPVLWQQTVGGGKIEKRGLENSWKNIRRCYRAGVCHHSAHGDQLPRGLYHYGDGDCGRMACPLDLLAERPSGQVVIKNATPFLTKPKH